MRIKEKKGPALFIVKVIIYIPKQFSYVLCIHNLKFHIMLMQQTLCLSDLQCVDIFTVTSGASAEKQTH